MAKKGGTRTAREASPAALKRELDKLDRELLKGDPTLIKQKKQHFPGYIPVLDAKNPPRFVMFCEVVKGKLMPQGGREVRSPAMLDIPFVASKKTFAAVGIPG